MNPKQQYKRNQALLKKIKSANWQGIEEEIQNGAQVAKIANEALQRIAYAFVVSYNEDHPRILKLLLENGADLYGVVTVHYDGVDRDEEIAKLIVRSGAKELIDVVYQFEPDFEIVTYLNAINREKIEEEMNQPTDIPLVDFMGEVCGSIKKEDILRLLDDDILWSDEWLDMFRNFTGSTETYRSVLEFLVEEILLHPAVFERDDWAEAAKSVVDCMVDYDKFAADLYGITLEEYQAYDGDDEGGAREIYADDNYSLTTLMVKLLSKPETFERNKDDWYSVFAYFGEIFEERAPFDTSQDCTVAELMKAPFLQGTDFGDNVKSCCKKHFQFAKF